jgi:hypothetical protein
MILNNIASRAGSLISDIIVAEWATSTLVMHPRFPRNHKLGKEPGKPRSHANSAVRVVAVVDFQPLAHTRRPFSSLQTRIINGNVDLR